MAWINKLCPSTYWNSRLNFFKNERKISMLYTYQLYFN